MLTSLWSRIHKDDVFFQILWLPVVIEDIGVHYLQRMCLYLSLSNDLFIPRNCMWRFYVVKYAKMPCFPNDMTSYVISLTLPISWYRKHRCVPLAASVSLPRFVFLPLNVNIVLSLCFYLTEKVASQLCVWTSLGHIYTFLCACLCVIQTEVQHLGMYSEYWFFKYQDMLNLKWSYDYGDFSYNLDAFRYWKYWLESIDLSMCARKRLPRDVRWTSMCVCVCVCVCCFICLLLCLMQQLQLSIKHG